MKTLVTYFTRTGNTKKVAKAIFDVIIGQKELKPLEEVAGIDQYDLIFVGSPIEKHEPVEQVKKFLKGVTGKKIALYITHAAPEHVEMASMYVERTKELVDPLSDLIGVFNCQGELSSVVAEHMMNSGNPQLQKFAGMRQMTLKQPDADRIARSKDFAKDMSMKAESISLRPQVMMS